MRGALQGRTLSRSVTARPAPGKPRARDNRFTPRVEQLGERLLPTISNFWVGTDAVLHIRTDTGNDQVHLYDNGASGVGNIDAVFSNRDTGKLDPLNASLNALL